MFRSFVIVFLFVVIVGPILLFYTALEPLPAVSVRAPSSASDAVRTRALFREFRSLTEAGADQKRIEVSQSDLNGAMAFAMRALPFLRGKAIVTGEAVLVALSADASRIPGGGWLNLRISIKPSDAGLRLASARLGSLSLPADVILPAIGFVLDVVLGDNLGQVAVNSIDSVSINGKTVAFGVALTRGDRKALARRAKNTVRAAAGISSPDNVRVYVMALDAAAKEGQVRTTGSIVPFLAHAMTLASQRSQQGDPANEIQSALHALAIYCGHMKYQNVVGDVVPRESRRSMTGCTKTTLGGRRDLRQHFVISAGLKAASDAGVAFAIGEFKELLDSDHGGSGFSFDDLAADRAGIRFATTFLEAKPDDWKVRLDKLVRETNVFPNISGLPAGLSNREFEHRFGTVDSPAYQSLLIEIDQRIDGLALYASR